MPTPPEVETLAAVVTVTVSVASVPVLLAKMPPVTPVTTPRVSTVTSPPVPAPPEVEVAEMPRPPDLEVIAEVPP